MSRIHIDPNKNLSWRLVASVASCALFGGSWPATGFANPIGGQVSSGQAQISASGNTLNVTQQSTKAVIDWRGFDIAPNETTRFQQPSAASMTLNRVNSLNPSQLLGTLTANGNIMIVNRNGVFFGKDSHIDVGGLIASTSDITNQDFMAGRLNFFRPGNPDARIVNQGSITARNAGLVGLVAPQVENSGVISARMGKVTLASGDLFALDLYGDEMIRLGLDDSTRHRLIEQKGLIEAEGGQVFLTAAGARNAVDSLITVTGDIKATRIDNQGGLISIFAAGYEDNPGTVLVSGGLDATGNRQGGTITVTGDHVGILNGSMIDASGDAGGGRIHIGGEYLGGGLTPRADSTVIQKDATLKANGGGGEVIAWSDDYTNFSGTIEANGGGGFVETSSKNVLQATGEVSAQNGQWLLDPGDITVQDDGGGAPDDTSTIDTDGPLFEAPAGTFALVTTEAIETALATADVTVRTGNAGGGAGDIIIRDNIDYAGGPARSLSFEAYRNILVDGANITSTGGALNLVLNSRYDGASASGYIRIQNNSLFTTNGGNVLMGGGVGAAGYAIGVPGSSGFVLIGGGIDAGSGNITIRGRSGVGADDTVGVFVLDNATIQTSSGDISITGQGGSGANHMYGVRLGGINTGNVTTQTGQITITGTGGAAAGDEAQGVVIDGNSLVSSTGGAGTPGRIRIVGIGGSGNNFIEGIYLNGGFVSSNFADIELDGTTTDNNSYGVNLENDSDITSTGATGGHISITGNSSAFTDFNITGGTISIGSANTLKDITINADEVAMANGLLDTKGILSFTPRTPTTTIGLAGGFGSGILSLTNAELGMITNNISKLVIGQSGTGIGDITAGPWNLSATPYAVELYGNDINLAGLTLGTGNFLAHAQDNAAVDEGDLTVSAAITKNLAGSSIIDLRADENVIINANITSATGSSHIYLNSDRDADQSGAVAVTGATINSNGGNIYLGGGLDPQNVAAYNGTGYSPGIVLDTSNIQAGSGNISMKAVGSPGGGNHQYGMFIDASTIQTGTGSINLDGTSQATGTFNYGIRGRSNSAIRTASGAVTITGNAQNAVDADSYGFDFENSTLESTSAVAGAGLISVTGRGAAAADGINFDSNSHINIGAAALLLDSTRGNLTLSGNISKASGPNSTATLRSNDSIILNTNGNIISSAGTLTTILNADHDGNNTGGISLNGVTVTTNGGNAYLVGGLDNGANGGTAADGIADNYASGTTTDGVFLTGATINTGIGNFLSRGRGNGNSVNGIRLLNSSINSTTNATIALDGILNGADGDFAAIMLDNSTVQAQNGNITFTGNATTDNGEALMSAIALKTGTVRTTGGNIQLTGTTVSDTINDDQYSVRMLTNSLVESQNGNATVHGDYTVNDTNNNDIAGVALYGNSTVRSTGLGSVTLESADSHVDIRSGTVQTANGNIAITAHSDETSTDNDAAARVLTSTVTAGGTGTIDISGYMTAFTNGVGTYLADSTITTDQGNITVIGDTTGSVNTIGVELGELGGLDLRTNSGNILVQGTGGGNNGIEYFDNGNAIGAAGMAGSITFRTDSLFISNDALSITTDAAHSFTLETLTAGTTMGIGDGTVGTLNLDNTEFSKISAGNYVFGRGDTGATQLGGNITFAQNASIYGSAIDIVGNASAGANTLLLDAATGNISNTAGTLTATTLNLDAAGTITADIDATNVDINNHSTGATLTGLVGGVADQPAADSILGGPGNNPLYRFAGFIIRLVSGGGGGTPPLPPVPTLPEITPATPDVPVVVHPMPPAIPEPSITDILRTEITKTPSISLGNAAPPGADILLGEQRSLSTQSEVSFFAIPENQAYVFAPGQFSNELIDTHQMESSITDK